MSVGGTKVPCCVAGGSGSCSDACGRALASLRCASRMPLCASASITGPTSVARRSGSPMRSSRHRALQHREDAVGDVLLQAEHAQRRAALAGAVEGRDDRRRRRPARAAPTSRRSSRSGRRSRRSAGSAGRAAFRRSASCALDQPRHVGRAGEHHALDARRRRPARAPTSPSPGRSCSAPAGTPASCRMRTACGGDQRRLLGRLGEHRVAGGQRRGDLAGEDRQREVPRADADDRAERPVRVVGRSRGATCVGVVAQEVDRLAHFGDGVGQRSCRPRARSGRAESASALPSGRRRAQAGGALGRRGRLPRSAPAAAACGQRGVDLVGVASMHGADDVAVIGRVEDRRGLRRLRAVGQQRHGAASALSALASSAAASAARRCSLARSRPAEFARSPPNRSRGRAIAGAARRSAGSLARRLDRIGDQLVDRTRRDRRCG